MQYVDVISTECQQNAMNLSHPQMSANCSEHQQEFVFHVEESRKFRRLLDSSKQVKVASLKAILVLLANNIK